MSGRHARPGAPPPASTAALAGVDLHKTYRRGREHVHALRGVTLAVHPGEVVALVGRSGSGKTTLLNCLLGWETPDSGTVTAPGSGPGSSSAGGRGRRTGWAHVAVVPQRFGLLEEVSLLDNVVLPARLAGQEDPRGAAEAALVSVGLGALADRAPGDVSLGEQQRTALARALVVRPALLVADEPTGRLDEETTSRVLAVLRDLCATHGTGVLLASHDTAAVAAADRVLRLDDGRLDDGRLDDGRLDDGRPDDGRPAEGER